MRRRPLACLMLLLFLILQLIPADRMVRSAGIVEKCKGQVTGTVTYRQHQKENMQLTLADCQIESSGSVQHADQLLVTLTSHSFTRDKLITVILHGYFCKSHIKIPPAEQPSQRTHSPQ